MKPHLVQQQTLQRKLNQSLIQSIQLLQFSAMELYDYLNKVIKENPLIEEVVYDGDINRNSYQASEAVSIDAVNSIEKTFYELIKEQLMTFHVPNHLLPIVEYGIDSLDEAGYLDITLEEWAENCQTTETIVEEALQWIQQLEPAGIGARNLSECIDLQLRRMDGYKEYMHELITHHLEWIADYNVEAIEAEYGIDTDEIEKLMQMIQSCSPRPGEILDVEDVEYIIPEAKIYKENGSWKISFYHWNSPQLIVNEEYKNLNDKEANKFLREKKEQLNWILGAIQYRRSTIELVIKKIVEKQLDFFEHGLMHLESMTLSDIAKELNMHPSTISRAINNKFVETPYGVFPIKFFFQSGVADGEGKKAAVAIKQLIRSIIEKEDKRKPLSDEKIKEKLKEDYSLNIARRTVMKYRQDLNIPASYKRRKE